MFKVSYLSHVAQFSNSYNFVLLWWKSAEMKMQVLERALLSECIESYMWHDQGKWVTCRQFSIFTFQYKSLVHLKCYILIQTASQLDIWLQRYDRFFAVLKQYNMYISIYLLACNFKSIFPPSDSFPLIMSQVPNLNF